MTCGRVRHFHLPLSQILRTKKAATMEADLRKNTSLRRGAMLVHALLWMAVVAWSYATAGHYFLTSCLQVIMIYNPPLTFLWLAVGFVSMAIFLISIIRRQLRASKWFWAACHGLLFAIGLQAIPLASYAAVGQVGCL